MLTQKQTSSIPIQPKHKLNNILLLIFLSTTIISIFIYISTIYLRLNTNYQKREGKLWTYTYANNTKAQIDYILINKKWKNSAMNCEAYSSFEGVSTDP